MTRVQNVSAVTETYTNNQGEEKSKWSRIGQIITKDDGKSFFAFDPLVKNYLRLLLGSQFEGICSVFEDNRENSNQAPVEKDDDVPF
ncbi:MAG: hypothetical protein ACPG5V_00800 [Vibrio cyclitrophicus]